MPAGSSTKADRPFTAKAHVAADADTALVEEVAVTPANINDGRAGPAALPDTPGEVFADSAYRDAHFREAVRRKGGNPPRHVRAIPLAGDQRLFLCVSLSAWTNSHTER